MKTTRSRTQQFLGFALLLATSNANADVPPQPRVVGSRLEVVVIQATNDAPRVGPGLEGLPLTRAPFTSYRAFSLVSRSMHNLGSEAVNVSLPNGDSATITMISRSPANRYEFSVQLNMSGQANTARFSASPGVPFFTARIVGQDNALILGFTVR